MATAMSTTSSGQEEDCQRERFNVLTYNTIIKDKYKVNQLIGWGAFGQVYTVTDLNRNKKRALKVCTERHAAGQDIARKEAELIKYLNKEDSKRTIVRYANHFKVDDRECLVMKLEKHTLLRYVNIFHKDGLQPKDARPIVKKILQGLQYLEEKEILHGDIRAENILTNAKGECVIADFGLAHHLPRHKMVLYDTYPYTSRRPPEAILRCPAMGYGIDMWCLGTVLLKLVACVTYDNPDSVFSRSQTYTLKKYLGLFGEAPTEFLNNCLRVSDYFSMVDGLYQFIDDDTEALNSEEPPLVEQVVTNARRLFDQNVIMQEQLDDTTGLYRVLTRMLEWDPVDRATPERALNDPYFA